MNGQRHRDMYQGGHPNEKARRANRWMAVVAASGILGPWAVRLDTVNAKTGRESHIPLATARVGGHRYLVSMLGEGARWVSNVRQAGGRARITCGTARDVMLVEVEPSLRAPILKNYVQRAPAGRPHIPVDRHAPVEEFAAIADRFPVFEILPR